MHGPASDAVRRRPRRRTAVHPRRRAQRGLAVRAVGRDPHPGGRAGREPVRPQPPAGRTHRRRARAAALRPHDARPGHRGPRRRRAGHPPAVGDAAGRRRAVPRGRGRVHAAGALPPPVPAGRGALRAGRVPRPARPAARGRAGPRVRGHHRAPRGAAGDRAGPRTARPAHPAGAPAGRAFRRVVGGARRLPLHRLRPLLGGAAHHRHRLRGARGAPPRAVQRRRRPRPPRPGGARARDRHRPAPRRRETPGERVVRGGDARGHPGVDRLGGHLLGEFPAPQLLELLEVDQAGTVETANVRRNGNGVP